jgi:beta-phosphoglucomutase
MPPRAVVFDFNGTLSEDEPILCEIFQELFAEHGRPLSTQEYFDELAGLSDPEVVRTWLGPGHPAVEEVIWSESCATGHESRTGAAFRPTCGRPSATRPSACPSGSCPVRLASRSRPCSTRRGSRPVFSALVSADDVERGKPDPAGYLRALELLDGALRPNEVLVFEDTEAGVAAAKSAGMRVFAVQGTLAPERLRDEIVERIDVELRQRLLP